MSKRLPYFQFEPAEWLAGDIMFCSLAAQGLFVNIKALYWQKDCDLSLEQAIKRLKNENLFEELISEKIIKINDGKIVISFLNNQYLLFNKTSKSNSENGKKGAEKRWGNRKENSESIARPLKNNSESIALREEKRREENIITSTNVEVEKGKKYAVDFDDSENTSDEEIKAAFLKSQSKKEKNVAPKKESNQDFANSLKFESPTWLENASMQNKKPPEYICQKLDEFLLFLSSTEKNHKSRNEFISHFINWISKKIKSEINDDFQPIKPFVKKLYQFDAARIIETNSR